MAAGGKGPLPSHPMQLADIARLRLRAQGIAPPGSASALDVVTRELSHDRPGRRAVLDRAHDLLLVTAVRAWFDRPESAAPARSVMKRRASG